MTKRLKSLKIWPLFVALSAVVIIAGIVLYVLLGFNTTAEKPAYKTFEVQYNVVAVINNKEEEIQKTCEDAFKENGLTFDNKEVYDVIAGTTYQSTGDRILVYTFAASASDEALLKAKTAAEKLVFKNADGEALAVEKTVTVNPVANEAFYEAGWRAAVAIAVAAVVALIYIGIRYGLASALSGLIGAINAVFFTLGLFVIARIPVFAVAPLLYAAIAAISFMLLWLLHCMKMRDNFKDPEFAKYDASEAVAASLKTSDKFVYYTAGALALVIALIGAVTASTSIMLLLLPAIAAVAVSLYSAALLAPAVHIPFKRAFDKFKKRNIRTYLGKRKEKATKNEAEE